MLMVPLVSPLRDFAVFPTDFMGLTGSCRRACTTEVSTRFSGQGMPCECNVGRLGDERMTGPPFLGFRDFLPIDRPRTMLVSFYRSLYVE
jgi:hypothetical protein